MENQVPLVCPENEDPPARLGQWVPEVHLEHQDHQDLLDFHLLGNQVRLVSLEQWDRGESLVLRDTRVSLAFLVPRAREGTATKVLRDPRAQLDLWVQAVCLESQEQVYLDPQATLVSLASLGCQEELVLQVQWVQPDQRVTLGLQVQGHQGKQERMVPLACQEQGALRVSRVTQGSQVHLACQV